jgi:GH15 family glucan-1,4-alpha-glucosidase
MFFQEQQGETGLTSRIEDYALIGDCETAAIVSRHGSIDWLCFPRFDSAACFAALLGGTHNGRWLIAPKGEILHSTRRYRQDTLILETDYETPEGAATVIDFMPLRDGSCDLIRIVQGRRGSVTFGSDLTIRFDYGRSVPWITHDEDGALVAIAGPDMLVLRTPVALTGEDMHTVGSFTVSEGESVPFVLTHAASHLDPPRGREPMRALRETEAFWRDFSSRCPGVGPWTEEVKRSLITLKALTYMPTGGIVAAATTSLPEHIGGTRNWDYRICWLRDATMTLLAFMKLGYYGEAEAWRDWLMRAVAGNPEQMQIMYGLSGERNLKEWDVPWLDGFLGSKPVRVGNAAAEQFQLDVYGEVADAMTQALRGGLSPHPRSGALAEVIMPYLEKAWREPDEGIWEVRGPRQHFTHSKVMAWVAFDRLALLAAEEEESKALAQRWRAVADEIHADVCAKGFSAERNSFVQAYGSTALDASLLHIALTGFLPATDPRVLGTVKAIEDHLTVDGLVQRYATHVTDDGLPPGEGVFLACSFWLADVMNMQGRREDALALFERLRGLANDVGLMAEEYDPHSQRMLGNFPQAFSHVGLINTALNLAGDHGPATDRAEHHLTVAPVC